MDVKICVTLICFTLASILQESAAVKCYECTSKFGSDKKCEDDFNSLGVPTIDCKLGCSKLKGEKDDLQYVKRMCAVIISGDDDCVSASAGGADGHLCTCRTDYCNSAMTTKASVFAVLITVVTLFIVMV